MECCYHIIARYRSGQTIERVAWSEMGEGEEIPYFSIHDSTAPDGLLDPDSVVIPSQSHDGFEVKHLHSVRQRGS